MSVPQPALIYCRVSSTTQVTRGHGLESQESRCREYAAAHGYTVEAVFPDDASGGGDFMKRPGMVALLSFLDAQPHKNYVIIFDDLKRFARDAEFHRKLRRELAARGARPDCLNFRFDDSPEGEFIETILAAQGELERKQNRRQVMQKMEARVRAGYWLFAPPVGYRYEKVPGHGKMLVRDDPAASLIREALTRYSTGQLASIAEVKRFVEGSPDFPTKTPGQVKIDIVKRMIERPIYAGYMTLEKWNLSMLTGKHEPLIDLEVWQKNQARLAGRALAIAPVRKSDSQQFPLRGFVACASCHRPMTGALSKGRSKHYAYYFCGHRDCNSYRKNIRADQIHDDFGHYLKTLSPQSQLLTAFRDIFRELWDEAARNAHQELDRLKRSLKDISTQIERTIARAIDADSPALIAAYESKVKALEVERAAMDTQITNFSAARGSFKDTIRTATEFLLNPWKLWDQGTCSDQKQLLRMVFADNLAYCPNQGIRTPEFDLTFQDF
ncbi:MAG: recombinase family protein [Mangrovicoccus sp.]